MRKSLILLILISFQLVRSQTNSSVFKNFKLYKDEFFEEKSYWEHKFKLSGLLAYPVEEFGTRIYKNGKTILIAKLMTKDRFSISAVHIKIQDKIYTYSPTNCISNFTFDNWEYQCFINLPIEDCETFSLVNEDVKVRFESEDQSSFINWTCKENRWQPVKELHKMYMYLIEKQVINK